MAMKTGAEQHRGEQLELEVVVRPEVSAPHGGRRRGAGRQRRSGGGRPNVAHRVRALHKPRFPVHVTLRLARGLPSLSTRRVREMFRSVVLGQRKRRYADTFQVVEFSIQADHVHLIVEAKGEDAPRELRAGVTGLEVAFAKRLNMMLGRRGKVWADRWHGRALTSPTDVRNALVYVLRNSAKHGTRFIGHDVVDTMSSAPRFKGYTRPLWWQLDDGEWPETPARTWLLGVGWRLKGGGPIDPSEVVRGNDDRGKQASRGGIEGPG